MRMVESTTAGSFLPEEIGKLVDLAVKAKSVAARTATVFSTDKHKVSFPKWLSDPAVAMYEELDSIVPADGTTGEVSALIYKTAGITRISNELRDDSSPAVGDLVGGALSNQITRAIDSCYLAATTAKGPDGLRAQSYTTVNASVASLDGFISARYAAEAAGSKLSSWIVRPAIAEALSKLKVQSGSNQSLLQFVADGIQVAGLPVLVSDQVDAGTLAWGIPSEHLHCVLVMRQGTTVERFPAVYNDGTDIRAISRFSLVACQGDGTT